MARTFASSSPCFAPSFMQLRNDRKCTQTLWNTPKHEFSVQWGGSGAFVAKNTMWLVARTFVLIEPVQYVLKRVLCSYGTIPNAPKYYKTYWYMTLGSNGVDWVRPLRKIATWLCGTNFCINCSSSSCFAPSFMQLRNDPKCTIPNAPKHYETHQNMSLGSNGVDQVRLFGKITTRLRGTIFCINWTSSVCFATSFMQLRNDPKH